MILVVYSGRKETKQQNYNDTYSERQTTYTCDTHTSYQRVNNVGYLGVPVMLKLRHNLRRQASAFFILLVHHICSWHGVRYIEQRQYFYELE